MVFERPSEREERKIEAEGERGRGEGGGRRGKIEGERGSRERGESKGGTSKERVPLPVHLTSFPLPVSSPSKSNSPSMNTVTSADFRLFSVPTTPCMEKEGGRGRVGGWRKKSEGREEEREGEKEGKRKGGRVRD